MSGIARHHSEWLSLIEVSGPFLTLPVLVRVFPQGLPKVDGKRLGRLRAAYEEWANAQDAKAPDAGALHATWVQLVLGELLEFDDQTLRSGDGLPSGLDVPLAEHHETLRPSIAIVEPSGRTKAGTPRLLVAVWPSNQDLESAVPAARWAASPLERMTQLCRSAGVRLGLVTNGERWTVVDAPVGQTAGYASWYAGLWLQEPITLAAFDALLGVRRFFAVADSDTIDALLDESVAFQQEVTDQLGYQVRRAVEVLVQALDRADLDRNRELLRDVPPARLYDAALTVMMRLVFLFCAEERGLLLLGDETYDANYAVSTLRALLREEADRVGVEVLERRQDAWARLLATFRAVHGGVEHEALRLPALGGSLFDPDRFPFLEGRAAGTSWLATPASPLPIDNRTVLHLLEALQLLRTRGDGGTSEARKLSYRALDIEQIGHVYEGLLDHVAVRVDTDTLGLLGTKDKEPELSLDELNRERRRGTDALIGFLKERTGRSTSALRNDLDAELDEVTEQRLLVACGNDRGLLEPIAPYHALIRNDVWGYPQIYRAGSFMVTGGPERRQTGTHYTPKSLTEQIVTETLEPLVYVGPAEGKPRDAWKLRSAAELLDLKICDMAMGSGAFLVQVCRWLAERVVEAWEEAERQGAAISAGGEVLERAAGHDLLPPDREERLSFARRLVAERCVYGVDINPMAVELAKLSLWLVTLAKGRPLGFLDHNLRSGDSLLGIHRLDQLTELAMSPSAKPQRQLFGQSIERAVRDAIELRLRLREMPIRDICDVNDMAQLDADARRKLEVPERVADALVGDALVLGPNAIALGNASASLAIQAGQAIGNDHGALEAIVRRGRMAMSSDLSVGKPQRKAFHWPLEFPEVFGGKSRGFDAFIGNPPYRGGSRITIDSGVSYRNYLVRYLTEDFVGRVDLCVYFLRQAARLSNNRASVGLVLTNSVAQGHSRDAGLTPILKAGKTIYQAVSDLPWPGSANVVVSLVWLTSQEWRGVRSLNGQSVEKISSSLLAESGSDWEPCPLKNNSKLCFRGIEIRGDGFVLSKTEADRLKLRNPILSEVIRPFLTGTELNSNWPHSLQTFVIAFGERSAEEAAKFEECWDIVVQKVKPSRDLIKKQVHEECFWKFWDKRAKQFEELSDQSEYLVKARDSTEWALAYVPRDFVISSKIIIFKDSSLWRFSCLQSGIHRVWCENGASTIGRAITYNPTIGLDRFAFPQVSSDLDFPAKKYLECRSRAMAKLTIGMNDLYRLAHSESECDPAIEEFRRAIEELDRAVISAYAWDDLDLEHGFHEVPYLPESDRVRFTISESARAEVLQRLCELNRQRFKEEVAQGLHGGAAHLSVDIPRSRRASNAGSSQPDLGFGTSTQVDSHDADPVRAVLDFLRLLDGWHAKADILAATGFTDSQWNSAITDLVTNGLVERQGERRGARYRARSGPHGARGARP